MSYTSESTLGKQTVLPRVVEIVELLGFIRVKDGMIITDRVGSYMWFEVEEYKSWSGVELDIYKDRNGTITVTTRSTVSRSYWDLTQQNRTLKMLRDLFGGGFITDEGRNRYLRPDCPPPSPRESGCYLARWRLHNSLIKPIAYLRQRDRDQPDAQVEPSGVYWIDDINPRFFSNNMILPFLVAVWEEYFRASFIALLKYSERREEVVKKANLKSYQLESIATKWLSVEDAVADTFSFQRPRVIALNFKLLDNKLDLEGVMKKPYRNRKKTLFVNIDERVEDRNEFVHSGRMSFDLTDRILSTLIKDFEVAAERCYQEFSRRYEFEMEPYLW